MKKKLAAVIVTVLVIAVLAFGFFALRQGIARRKMPDSVTLFAASAKGVSYNIRDILENPDDFSEPGLSGVSVYFDQLIKYAPQLETLCADEAEFEYFLFMLQSRYNEFCAVYDSFSSIGALSEEDIAFLSELKTSLDTLRAAMVKENGKADIRVLKDSYFTKAISAFSGNEY